MVNDMTGALVSRAEPVKIAVWDPNGVNPYGSEVAAVLQRAGCDVELWTTVDSSQATAVPTKRRLASARATTKTAYGLTRRAMLPTIFFISVVVQQRRPVITWSRGAYESLLFRVLASARPLIVVDHNPVLERRERGVRHGAFQKLLARASVVVQHSQKWADPSGENSRANIAVARHPSYRVWTAHHNVSRKYRDDDRPRLLYLGALRKDKGLEELIAILDGLDETEFSVHVLATGSEEASEKLVRFKSSSIEISVSDRWHPDNAVAQALSESDVLIAPYKAATVSGTVNMALTVGLDVIAYDTGAMSEYLSKKALVPAGDSAIFIATLQRWRLDRFDTALRTIEELEQEAVRDWGKIATGL